MINSIFYEPYAWFGREIIETSKALIPATSPSARYGLSVFEGIRSYLLNDGRGISIFRLNDHVDRLFYSAERMSLPIEFTKDSIPNIVERVIDRNNCYTDAYIRIDALSSGSGSWHSKEPATLMITITKQNMSTTSTKKPVSVGISNWRRIQSKKKTKKL